MANDQSRAIFSKASSGGEMFAFDSVQGITDYVNPDLYEVQDREFVFGEENKGEDLENWEKVQERSKKDWAEGMYVFQQFVDRLTSAALPDVKSKRRVVRFGTEGDEIDFERMRQGYTDFWRTTTREESTGPATMTVVIDTSTPSNKNSDDILWRGAVGIALAKILEEKGWGVEIWVVNGSTLYMGEDTSVYTACCLKKPGDPLDVSTLINTVSGWFYRTAIFALIATVAKNRGKKLNWGYGQPRTPTEQDLDLLTRDEYRIYSAGVFTFEGALQIVESQLEKIREQTVEE